MPDSGRDEAERGVAPQTQTDFAAWSGALRNCCSKDIDELISKNTSSRKGARPSDLDGRRRNPQRCVGSGDPAWASLALTSLPFLALLRAAPQDEVES